MRRKRPRLKPDEHPRPNVTVPMTVFGEPLFSSNYALLGWFVHQWCHAVWKKDPRFSRFTPCTASDVDIALRTGFLVERAGALFLTGPHKDPRWLLDAVKQFSTYAIADDNGNVKIGKTLDVDRRLDELQCAAAGPLVLLGVVNRDIEDALHGELDAHRTSGEWFALNDAVRAVLQREGLLG